MLPNPEQPRHAASDPHRQMGRSDRPHRMRHRRQRAQDGRPDHRRRQGDDRGRRRPDHGVGQHPGHARPRHPRDGHRLHGQGPEEVGAEHATTRRTTCPTCSSPMARQWRPAAAKTRRSPTWRCRRERRTMPPSSSRRARFSSGCVQTNGSPPRTKAQGWLGRDGFEPSRSPDRRPGRSDPGHDRGLGAGMLRGVRLRRGNHGRHRRARENLQGHALRALPGQRIAVPRSVAGKSRSLVGTEPSPKSAVFRRNSVRACALTPGSCG